MKEGKAFNLAIMWENNLWGDPTNKVDDSLIIEWEDSIFEMTY